MPNRAALIAGLAVAGLMLLAWWQVPSLPLTGADTWPILAQADRLGDRPLATLAEPYLDGLWDGARFWRPLLTLFAAVEWRAFGAWAAGYHLLRLLLLAAAALLAGRLAAAGGREDPAARAAAGGLAAAIVVLHPVQLETVPVVARDADGLSAVAILASLLLLLPGRQAGAARLAAGVAAALAAGLIKETGLAAPLIALGMIAGTTRQAWRVPRLRWAALALAAGLAAQVAARLAVIGGIGGYLRVVRPVPLPRRALELGAGLLGGGSADQQAALGALAALAGLLLIAAMVLGAGALRRAETRLRGLRWACAVWVLLGAAGALASPRMSPRYAEALVPPLAIVCGALAGALLSSRRPGRAAFSAATAAALGVSLALILLPRSPLASGAEKWRRAGSLSERVLVEAHDVWIEMERSRQPAAAQVEGIRLAAEPLVGGGGVLSVDPFPYQPRPAAGNAADHPPAMALMPYSVRAYLLLRGARPPVAIRPGRPLHAGGRAEGD